MPCYRPFVVYRLANGSISFKGKKDQGRGETLELPCGHCAGCRLEASRQWAVRCMHEASLYEKNAFVTLTYNDCFLPSNWSLCYEHFQGFMRRLRYEFGKVRFYMCGEYGEVCKICRKSVVYCKCAVFESDLGRPHFHACLFGIDFDDKQFYQKSPVSGEDLYRSRVLDRLWYHGNSYIGAVTFESAAYVARYLMKKVNGDLAVKHYEYIDSVTGETFSRVPEFNRMSLKPGIGAVWFDKYERDVYPSGQVVVRGIECMPPRYYEKRYRKLKAGSDELAILEMKREKAAMLRYKDNTPDRLLVKEKVRLAAVKMLKRNYKGD